MDELFFPIAAVALTFLLLIPALTLVSRTVLAQKRKHTRSWPSFGSETTFAWLVAPTLLPIAWLLSSALHQIEPRQALQTCLVDHVNVDPRWISLCLDGFILLGLVVGGISLITAARAWRERPRMKLERIAKDDPLAIRIAHIVSLDENLHKLRVHVVCQIDQPVFTLGSFKPRVILDACFVRDADDEIIRAALLHEHAHITGFDTLRTFLARLCLAINPAGSLLSADFERWRHAREAQCDAEAVQHGGEPLALAEGIIRAARFHCAGIHPRGAAMLCGHDASSLKLRLALLLNGSIRPIRTIGHAILATTLIIALTIPHLQGMGLLSYFHSEVERMLHTLP